jgi:site-specific DNA-methyltransferase (cytosine-N4-specific)
MRNHQLSLFDHVQAAYANSPSPLTQEALYQQVSESAGLTDEHWQQRGKTNAGQSYNVLKREIRWHQQTLKHAGLLEQAGKRGRWKLTKEGKAKLRKVEPKSTLVAFSTELGVALWSLCEDVFDAIDAPITLCLTSPPYPLRKQRAYGDPTDKDYVKWLVNAVRPVAERLVQGGSICLNVGNDVFEPGKPSRSLYKERLVLALADELGLHLMDSLIWHNPTKPPSPTYWACVNRYQLNARYEVIYWFTNDPDHVRSDNRRVLQPHSERHLKLMAKGGESNRAEFSDGAHRKRPGSFGNVTEGRIAHNIMTFPHRCKSQSDYKRMAREHGIAAHGAPYPLALAKFLIEFLTKKGELVVDLFGGSLTTAVGCEELERPWITTEAIWEYNRGGGLRLSPDVVRWNPEFLKIANKTA